MDNVKALNLIFDQGSFMELAAGQESAVITGYGTVSGRQVYAFIQNSEVEGGAFGIKAARKIRNIYGMALKAKAPVIGLLDSAGFLVDEGAEALNAFSDVFASSCAAKDSILQIMIVGGKCMGQMVSLANNADFFFKDMELEEAAGKVEELIRVLPPARGMLPEQYETGDDLNRINNGIEKKADSGKEMLKELSDDGFLLEVDGDKAPELTAGFIKVNGIMVAAMANNRTEAGNRIGLEALVKARRLVETADKFSLALLKVSRTDGLSLEENQTMLMRASAKLQETLLKTDIPKVDLITGTVTGPVYSIFNAKGTSADMTFMWKDAKVNILNPRQACEVLGEQLDASNADEKADEYEKSHSTGAVLEEKGLVDRVIDPEESRKYLAGALETYANVF